jgi:hypothetical protein
MCLTFSYFITARNIYVTEKLGFFMFLECLFFLILGMFFIGPTNLPIRTLNFPGIYVCVVYSVPGLYVQVEHKLTCSCNFKYFQL